MNIRTLTVLLLMYSVNVFSQSKVEVSDAENYVGEAVKVSSKVYGVKSLVKLSLLNLGARFPKSPLTVVFYEESRNQLKDTPENLFDNKNACVTD